MTDAATTTSPLATWDIPLVSGATLSIMVRPGEVLTAVGSNGAGKSALASWMASRAPAGGVRRVLAHRKLWFQSSGPAISPADRETYATNIANWDRNVESRYVDYADNHRANIALFDLLGKLNHESRQVAALYDEGASREEVDTAVGERLLTTLNTVLEAAGLLVVIEVTERDTFLARHRDLGTEYPIYKMSDGERAALLLAAEVLTAPPNFILVLDEPERHLHRSISAGLIAALINARSDCGFVVLTHDLDLAWVLSSRSGTVLSLSGIQWQEEQPVGWDAHVVPPGGELDDTARRAVLGGRRQVLFVEGSESSLDLPLYRSLFPLRTIVPSGNCDAVIRAVSGLNDSQNLHWIDAAGMVDRDGRTEEECESLIRRGVNVLPVSEVENLYYTTPVIAAVANKQAATLGVDASELASKAKDRALSGLKTNSTPERISAKLAKDAVARRLLAHMPEDVGTGDIEISFESPYSKLLGEVTRHLADESWEDLVTLLPIRDTAARNEVAKALGFRSVSDYQRAAQVCIASDPQVRSSLGASINDPTESADVVA